MSYHRAKEALGFELKTPCADCPFKTTTPLHDGVAVDLPELLFSMVKGQALHTCHRTDGRSDYEAAKNHSGPVQVCAGFLLMADKSRMRQLTMMAAAERGLWDPEQMDREVSVYAAREMLSVYRAYTRQKLKEEEAQTDENGGVH